MSLYGSAVKRPITTLLCFVTVIILGLFSLSKLPIDLYPDIDTNTIMVITMYPGASAKDIEQNVTKPLENTLNSVEHLKHITSTSRENTSVITLEFEYGYDIDVLTNDVRDKLDMVESQLPDDSENPIIFKFSTDMIPIVMLSVQASESMPGLTKSWMIMWPTRWHASTEWARCQSRVRPNARFTSTSTRTAWRPTTFRSRPYRT